MCSDFESRLKNIKHLGNSLPSSTMVPIDACTAGSQSMERAPRRQIMELSKSLIFTFCTWSRPNMNLLSYRWSWKPISVWLLMLTDQLLLYMRRLKDRMWLSRLRFSFPRISASWWTRDICRKPVCFLGNSSHTDLAFTTKNVLLKRESKKPLALRSSGASSSVRVVLFAKVSPCKIWRKCPCELGLSLSHQHRPH